MNRKIVFRGKDLQTKEWRHGYLYRLKLPSGFANMILVGDDVEIEMDNSLSPRHHLSFTLEKDLYAVSSDTIGQFTGLQDSKGNDIYEGDIIDIGDGEYSVVSYSDSHALFDLSPNGLFSQEAIIYGGFEVVGNVFDNLDLLK